MRTQDPLRFLGAAAAISCVACSSPAAPNPSSFPPYGYVDLAQGQDALAVHALFGVPSTNAQLPGDLQPDIYDDRDTTCAVQQVEGACTIIVCSHGSSDPVTHPGVGTLSVQATNGPALAADVNYGRYQENPMMDASGAPVIISAPGAELPGFSVTVRVPSPLTLTAPDTSSGLTIDRARDFSFTWSTGDGLDDVEAYLATSPLDYTGSNTTRKMIACTYPRAAGRATMPASLLGQFAPDDLEAGLRPVRTQTVGVGAYEVTVRAEGDGTTGLVTLQ